MKKKGFSKLFMLKIRLFLWWSCKKDEVRKVIHCKRGYHRIDPSRITAYRKGRKRYQIDYAECKTCGGVFFVDEEEKKKYIANKKESNSFMVKMLDGYKKKQEGAKK